jgi:pimeloyl-ACP methyl ester carboxylesterase
MPEITPHLDPNKPTRTLGRRRMLLGGAALGVGIAAAAVGGVVLAGAGGGHDDSDRDDAPGSETGSADAAVAVGDGTDEWHARVAAAGYVGRRATVGDVSFSYVEGPDNGPALVLLHAQQMDWFSYSRVLPALAESYHVFDVDYQGHGRTVTPDGYPMTANRIGPDVAQFIEQVVQGPAFVTGNSSGGLLTTWLAANRPDLVKAALLEDPPLFSSEYPRIKKTIADRDFVTSADYLGQDTSDDFLLFWIDASKPFFEKNLGKGSALLLSQAVRGARISHPGQPVEIGLIPNDTIRLFLRGMDHQYDPHFGAAFHLGTWNEGFDHAAALKKITVPTMLLHADYTWTDQDILNGAMSDDDAARAMALLSTGTYRKIDATHVTHLDKPDEFTTILTGFFTTG